MKEIFFIPFITHNNCVSLLNLILIYVNLLRLLLNSNLCIEMSHKVKIIDLVKFQTKLF